VIEGAGNGDFCGGVIEIKAAQLIDVREQIVSTREIPLQFGSAETVEPADIS
jgi:hypothetical protein